MIIIIQKQEIEINNLNDLIRTLKQLPTDNTDDLMLEIMSNQVSFRTICHGAANLQACLNTLPEKYAAQLLQHVLENSDEFERIFSNHYLLSQAITTIPERYAETIMRHVLNSPVFSRIFASDVAIINAAQHFPERYADEIIDTVWQRSEEYKRLIENKYSVQAIAHKMPKKYHAAFFKKISSDIQEISRLVSDFDDLKIFLEIFPEEYANELLRNVIADPNQFLRIINIYTLQCAVTELPQNYAQAIVTRYDTLHKETALHAAAKFKPELIPVMSKFGSRPLAKDSLDHSSLYYFLNHKNQSLEFAISLIEDGCDVNVKNREGNTCLHKMVENSDAANMHVPFLLKQGADPRLTNAHGRTALQVLMTKSNFSEKDIDPALALIQHGANANTKNSRGKNILQIMYQTYPELEKYVTAKGVEKKDINDPDAVFNKIKIASLRLELLRDEPGDINVLQRTRPEFTLFRSVKTLIHDFEDLKQNLKRTQHHRHPIYDKLTKKEFTNTSLQQISEFRYNALSYIRDQAAFFNEKRSRLALVEIIEETELCQSVKYELLK